MTMEMVMAKVKLSVWNKRMLLLMQHMVDNGTCSSQKDFLQSVGFNHRNMTQLRTGKQSFTVEQMVTACKKYHISMNWMTGLSDQMALVAGKSPLEQLKMAVRAVEAAKN